MDPCTSAGLTPYNDPLSGITLYCVDPTTGDVSYPPGLASSQSVTGPTGTPTQTSQQGAPTTNQSTLGVITGIENDFLTGWRTITQPGLPPGQIGITFAGGPAGGTLSGSPILLIALVAVLFFALRD